MGTRHKGAFDHLGGRILALLPAVVLAVAAWGGGFYSGARLWGSVAVAIMVLGVVVAAALAGRLPARRWLDPLALGEVAGKSTVLSRVPALLLMTVLAVAIGVSWWESPVMRAGLVAIALLPAYLLLPAVVAGCWRSLEERRWGLAGVAVVVLAVAVHGLWDHGVMGSERAAMPLGHHNLLAVWLLAVLPLVLPLVLAPGRRVEPNSSGGENRGESSGRRVAGNAREASVGGESGEAGAGRDSGGIRWLGGAALVAGLVALLATRSLAGASGLVVALVLTAALLGERWVSCPKRRWAWTGVGVLAVGALAVPRLLRITAGEDVSALARWGYWQAGWRGFLERPWLGWGPGGTPWTLGVFLEPRPGVNPPGEVVGQLHGQPVQVLYEVGTVGAGLVVVVVVWFLWVRVREARREESTVGRTALVALGGVGVALLSTSVLEIPGVVVALAVAAGGAMTYSPTEDPRRVSPDSIEGRRVFGWVFSWTLVTLYALIALLGLFPLWQAQSRFELFVESGGTNPLAVRAARGQDWMFGWYQAWEAWSKIAVDQGSADPETGNSGASGWALNASSAAPGVSVFPLTGGAVLAESALQRRREATGLRDAGYPVRGADLRGGAERAQRGAEKALARACHLDPLGPFAPWIAMTSAVQFGELDGREAAAVDGAVDGAARALLAEPRLLAATFWHGREELRRAAVERVTRWPGVPVGLRAAWADGAVSLPPVAAPGVPDASLADLALTIDADPAQGLALHLFRRAPLTVRPLAVEVDAVAAATMRLPSAAVLRETSPEAFADLGCPPLETPVSDPQALWKTLWKSGGSGGGKDKGSGP